jgi:hypothetical protein
MQRVPAAAPTAGTRLETGFGTMTRPFVVSLRPKTNGYPPLGRLNRSALPRTHGR